MIYTGDALAVLKTMPSESVNMCVTSPPYYGLRDYGVDGQIGLEETPEAYIERLTDVFREVRRVLRNDGTLWVNIGDSYCGTGDKGDYKDPKYAEGRNGQSVSRTKTVNGCKPKDLIGIPWMLAFSLRSDGWYLRSDIIWDKSGNCFPESVRDRCTKAHEYIFMFSKQQSYYYDNDAIREPVKEVSINRAKYGWHGKGDHGTGNYAGLGQVDTMERFVNPNGRNKRDVWHINTASYKGAHFATFPEKLAEPCVLAGCPSGGVVLDCFNGAGTTGVVCMRNDRDYIGIELNPTYVELAEARIAEVQKEVEAAKAQMSFDDFVS